MNAADYSESRKKIFQDRERLKSKYQQVKREPDPAPPTPKKDPPPPQGIIIEGVKLYDFDETATLMRMSRRSVQSYYAKGWIQGRKMGRKVYILAESIAAFLRGERG